MPRKPHSYHYLYKTTCSVTGRYYYGMHSTSSIDDGYLGSGKRLWLSIRKYGEENHSREILEMFDTRESLIAGEKMLITDEILKDPMCMNLMKGGKGGKISDAQQRNRSATGGKALSNRLKSDLSFMENFSKISSDRIKRLHEEGKVKAVDWTGKTHTAETKKKMSDSKKITAKGERNSQFGKMWIFSEVEQASIRVKHDDLAKYLDIGWKIGRKMKW